MIRLQNKETGAQWQSSSLYQKGGVIMTDHVFPRPSEKWLQRHAEYLRVTGTQRDEAHDCDVTTFEAVAPWEVVLNKVRARKAPKETPKKKETPKETPKETEKETKKDGRLPHPLLQKLLLLVKNDRLLRSFPWLVGPAGTGKSTLAGQVAEELGLQFGQIQSPQQKYEFEGFAGADGKFCETEFYRCFRYGGVYLIDEFCTSPAEVIIALNSALANLRYCFPVVGMVNAHPDFHCIVADNTSGEGGDRTYNGRFKLDGSSIDRFCFLHVEYTPELELFMAGGDSALVSFNQEVREVVKAAKLTHVVSPRSSARIAGLLKIGFDIEEALYIGLCGGWSAQTTKTIAAALHGSSKYNTAFVSLAKKLK